MDATFTISDQDGNISVIVGEDGKFELKAEADGDLVIVAEAMQGIQGPAGAQGPTASITAVTVTFAEPSKGRFFYVAFAGAVVGQKVLAAPSLKMPAGVAEDELEADPVFAYGHVKTAGQVRLFVGSVNGGILGGDRTINVTIS